jgi:ketosteroid isomerase-like protein
MLRIAVDHRVRRVAVSLVFAILVGVGLPSWQGPTKPARAQSVEPGDRAAVLTGLLTALNNGDLDGALALFADNAVFVGAARSGGTCSQATPCTDAAGIRQQLQNAVVGSHTCFTLRSLTVSGAVVTGQRDTRNDVTRRNGIDRDIEDFFALVPDGQITFWAAVKNVGDPETALDLAISAGTQPPGTPIPAPGTPCGPV